MGYLKILLKSFGKGTIILYTWRTLGSTICSKWNSSYCSNVVLSTTIFIIFSLPSLKPGSHLRLFSFAAIKKSSDPIHFSSYLSYLISSSSPLPRSWLRSSHLIQHIETVSVTPVSWAIFIPQIFAWTCSWLPFCSRFFKIPISRRWNPSLCKVFIYLLPFPTSSSQPTPRFLDPLTLGQFHSLSQFQRLCLPSFCQEYAFLASLSTQLCVHPFSLSGSSDGGVVRQEASPDPPNHCECHRPMA